jgi:tyrosine-specific transport protein
MLWPDTCALRSRTRAAKAYNPRRNKDAHSPPHTRVRPVAFLHAPSLASHGSSSWATVLAVCRHASCRTSFVRPSHDPRARPHIRPGALRMSATSPEFDSTDVGCASLLAGTMVGAGVLALPAVSAPAGFVPASGALLLTWAYMAAAAMLGAEVALHTSCALGRPNGVSLLSQARLTLGPLGAALCSASYVFLHYAVLVAYVSQGAEIGEHVLGLPHAVSGGAFLGTVGVALYLCNERQLDNMNNALFLTLIASFIAVMLALVPDANPAALFSRADWLAVPRAVPTLLLSCVYHNVVGSVATRLKADVDRVRRVVVLGSGVPLVMFILANGVVLAASNGGLGDVNPLAALTAKGGLSAVALESFAFLAVTTSALGFIEGLNQMWNDARITLLKEAPETVAANPLPSFVLTVTPPIVLSAMLPGSFLSAIDIAGLYGVSILFGVLPAAMAWRQRYADDAAIATAVSPAVPGGKLVLGVMMFLPSALVIYNSLRLGGVL